MCQTHWNWLHTHIHTHISTRRARKNAFIYLKTTFQDFLGFSTADRAVNGNFFITTNTEWTNGVTCFWENWLLSSQLFQHLESGHLIFILRLEFLVRRLMESPRKREDLRMENEEFTLAARVSLSPDSPTQMFKHNLRICKSRITFLAGSFLIFLAESAWVGLTAAGCKIWKKNHRLILNWMFSFLKINCTNISFWFW